MSYQENREKELKIADLQIRMYQRALIDKHHYSDVTRRYNQEFDGVYYAVLRHNGFSTVFVEQKEYEASPVAIALLFRVELIDVCTEEKEAQKTLERTLEDIICFGEETDALCLSCGLTELFGDDVMLAAERLSKDMLIDKDGFSFSWITEHEAQYHHCPDEWLMYGVRCKNCKCEVREPRDDIAWYTFQEAQNECGELLGQYIEFEGIEVEEAENYRYAVQYDGFESDKIVNILLHETA